MGHKMGTMARLLQDTYPGCKGSHLCGVFPPVALARCLQRASAGPELPASRPDELSCQTEYCQSLDHRSSKDLCVASRQSLQSPRFSLRLLGQRLMRRVSLQGWAGRGRGGCRSRCWSSSTCIRVQRRRSGLWRLETGLLMESRVLLCLHCCVL